MNGRYLTTRTDTVNPDLVQNPYAAQNVRLAHSADFETFTLHRYAIPTPCRSIQDYYLWGGRLLPNTRILRVESLNQQLPKALQEIAVGSGGHIPHLNSSRHADWRSYYTKVAADAVYDRYKWVFDSGHYQRIDPSTFSFVKRAPFNADVIANFNPAL
jgi:hypothetical protein